MIVIICFTCVTLWEFYSQVLESFYVLNFVGETKMEKFPLFWSFFIFKKPPHTKVAILVIIVQYI